MKYNDKNMAITLSKRIEVARLRTSKTANMKDWRIRNKHNRAMREIAREWIGGKGYIIASVKGLSAKYGDLCRYEVSAPGADEKRVWGISFNIIHKRIHFVAF